MKKVVIGTLAIIGLIASIFFTTAVMTSARMSDKSFLMKQIRSERSFSNRRFEIDRFSKEQVERMVRNDADLKTNQEKEVARKKLISQKDDVIYFYFEKSFIKYYISHDIKSNECRLAVQSTHSLMKKINIPILKQHLVHYIDKPICNGLYGYGKPF